jgi:hypothetical protein
LSDGQISVEKGPLSIHSALDRQLDGAAAASAVKFQVETDYLSSHQSHRSRFRIPQVCIFSQASPELFDEYFVSGVTMRKLSGNKFAPSAT